jgi:hypothetical protein
MMKVETNGHAAAVAEQGAIVAPQKAALKKGASRKKGAPQGQKTAKGGQARKPAKTGQKPAQQARQSTASKSAKILEMIGRTKGATLAEIVTATGWQAHSVRGFISTAGNKHGIKIESAKNELGGRFYRIAP